MGSGPASKQQGGETVVKAPAFQDHRGRPRPYDDRSAIGWRVSIYTVVIRDDRLLLMKPAYSDHYDLPGGAVEQGETLIEAAIRECYEETGFHLNPANDLPVHTGEQWYYEDDDGSFYHSLFFALRGNVIGEPDPAWTPIAGETEQVVWLPLTSLSVTPIHPNHRAALLHLAS